MSDFTYSYSRSGRSALLQTSRILVYIVSLGFVPKYRGRLYYYEYLDPEYASKRFSEYYESPSLFGALYWPLSDLDSELEQVRPWIGTLREKQSEEWNKLSTAASVITATSAAALAIPGLAGTDAYWLVNCCFCTALGVSLEGLLLVQYLSVLTAGTSDSMVGALARGKMRIAGIRISSLVPAIIMSLPMCFTTYSALYLLGGTIVMVVKGRHGPNLISVEAPSASYYLPIIPIIFGLLCLILAIILCEAGTHYELRERNQKACRGWKRSLAEMGLVGVAPVVSSFYPGATRGLQRPIAPDLKKVSPNSEREALPLIYRLNEERHIED